MLLPKCPCARSERDISRTRPHGDTTPIRLIAQTGLHWVTWAETHDIPAFRGGNPGAARELYHHAGRSWVAMNWFAGMKVLGHHPPREGSV